jgi:tetratricopeptide (TPR) repeat protein
MSLREYLPNEISTIQSLPGTESREWYDGHLEAELKRGSGFSNVTGFAGNAAVWLVVLLLSVGAGAQANPAGFDDLVLKADAAREQNDAAKAIELYRQAVALKPEWPDGWWFLGLLQYGTDSYADARDALTHYIALTPNAGPAFALRGLCEFESGDYAPSLNDIERGLSLGAANQPRNEKILRYHEALLLTRSGNFEIALQKFAFFAGGKVPNPEFLVAIGLAGLRTPLLPKELRADKQDLYGAVGSAAFHFLSGDEKTARQEFQDVFQHYPTAANVHYLYGYLQFPRDADAGIAEFKRELEITPASAPTHAMLAWGELIQNNAAEALPYAEKAVAEDAALPSGQLVLGRALLETGDLKGGIEHLEKELQLEPNNLEAHLALVKAYSKSGRKEDARRERLLCLEITRGEDAPVARP